MLIMHTTMVTRMITVMRIVTRMVILTVMDTLMGTRTNMVRVVHMVTAISTVKAAHTVTIIIMDMHINTVRTVLMVMIINMMKTAHTSTDTRTATGTIIMVISMTNEAGQLGAGQLSSGQAGASQLGVRQLGALLQLSSPSLPIGGFSYSQGLEAAVELGLVHNEQSAQDWIQSQLRGNLIHCDAPIFLLLHQAWQAKDPEQVRHWSQWYYASRETQEARQETRQMAQAMRRLLHELNWGEAAERELLQDENLMSFPTVHSFAMYSSGINAHESLLAYLFTWLENQVMAAIKSIPLGQSSGQRIIQQCLQLFEPLLQEAQVRAQQNPPDIETLSPMYGIVSACHETLFSRLFRS